MKNRLEEIRKFHNIKQEELAKALRVSRQTIGSLENGRYNPSIMLAFKIAKFFKVTVEEMFIYEEEETHEIKIATEAFPHAPVEAEKAWPEMIHRYFAGSLGLLVAALAIIGFVNRSKNRIRTVNFILCSRNHNLGWRIVIGNINLSESIFY